MLNTYTWVVSIITKLSLTLLLNIIDMFGVQRASKTQCAQ